MAFPELGLRSGSLVGTKQGRGRCHHVDPYQALSHTTDPYITNSILHDQALIPTPRIRILRILFPLLTRSYSFLNHFDAMLPGHALSPPKALIVNGLISPMQSAARVDVHENRSQLPHTLPGPVCTDQIPVCKRVFDALDDFLALVVSCAHIEDVGDYVAGAEGRDGVVMVELAEAVAEDGGWVLVGRWHGFVREDFS